MGHFPNLTLQAVDTLINGRFLWIFHVSMWVDQISPRGWSESRGSARPLLNNPSAPKRPWIKPGQVTKQTFFQSSLSWKGPVSPTQWNIISGLSFKPSPWSSLQVHWQSMERLAKGRWLCSPCYLLLRRSGMVVLYNMNSAWFLQSTKESKICKCLQHAADWKDYIWLTIWRTLDIDR